MAERWIVYNTCNMVVIIMWCHIIRQNLINLNIVFVLGWCCLPFQSYLGTLKIWFFCVSMCLSIIHNGFPSKNRKNKELLRPKSIKIGTKLYVLWFGVVLMWHPIRIDTSGQGLLTIHCLVIIVQENKEQIPKISIK